MNAKTIVCLSSFLVVLATSPVQAQNLDTTIQGMSINLDAVVIRSSKSGWDIDAFIKRMKEDTTFYKAFLGLRVVPYTSDNEITIYDDHKMQLAHLENRTEQTMIGNCRSVKVSNEKVTGHYYDKKHNPKYYTAELFQNLFFRARTNECGATDNIAESSTGKGRMEKNKEQLKQMVFNPGSKVEGIPFVGKKASIFDEDMLHRYQFSLKFARYNGVDCYLFQASPKDNYKDDVVFNQLDTWFRESDFSIIGRNYSLSYHTLFYDFDVVMKVSLEKVGQRLLPATIDYKGNWHVFSKKRERVQFNLSFDY